MTFAMCVVPATLMASMDRQQLTRAPPTKSDALDVFVAAGRFPDSTSSPHQQFADAENHSRRWPQLLQLR